MPTRAYREVFTASLKLHTAWLNRINIDSALSIYFADTLKPSMGALHALPAHEGLKNRSPAPLFTLGIPNQPFNCSRVVAVAGVVQLWAVGDQHHNIHFGLQLHVFTGGRNTIFKR